MVRRGGAALMCHPSIDRLVPCPRLLTAARKALRATPPPPVGAPVAAQNTAAVEAGNHLAAAKGMWCHRRRTCAPDGRGTPALQAVQG
jgi:hypothetical protein